VAIKNFVWILYQLQPSNSLDVVAVYSTPEKAEERRMQYQRLDSNLTFIIKKEPLYG
jgi:hypothetical protein